VAAADFFRGIYTTAVEPGEVVTEIVVPPGPGWRTGFEELARRHGDFALAGLAARLRLEGRTVREARLVFLGVGTRPARARSAETALAGRGLDPETLAAAGRALTLDLDPPGDIHASPALRRHLAGVLLARVLRRMMDGAA
jgi:carbon-monoxide dehydrogenase medium subunit